MNTKLDLLFTGKIRLKLLLRLFLNPGTEVYLRALAREFEVSTNTVRQELNLLQTIGLLSVDESENGDESKPSGKVKRYEANTNHPVFKGLRDMLRQHVGIEALLDKVIQHVEGIQSVYVTGDLAQGRETSLIDLIVVGENVQEKRLTNYIKELETHIEKKIRFAVITPKAWEEQHIAKIDSMMQIF